jgi:hypothetical protein
LDVVLSVETKEFERRRKSGNEGEEVRERGRGRKQRGKTAVKLFYSSKVPGNITKLCLNRLGN